jgi:endonuclease/exonuclease/phosphatase family metal-dependent hydrolase
MKMKSIIVGILVLLFATTLSAQKFTVGTFNLRYDNPRDSGNLWKDRLPRVAALIEFHDFDILGTQEGLQHQLDSLQVALPAYSYYGIGRDDAAKKGEHSAIFYKTASFTVIDKGDFWLSETPTKPGFGWDARINRICSWLLLNHKKTGKQFYCFNVHYDHQGMVARKESSKLIVAKIKSIAGDSPVILTGDFNGDHSSEWYQLIANSGLLLDTYTRVAKPYMPNGTFQGFGPNLNKDQVIDHIFTTKHFAVSNWGVLTDSYNGKFPSDHFPVISRVSLK